MFSSPLLENICMEIPKAEMHVHIEGTLEPELLIEIAHRNNISILYKTTEELKKKYIFQNLQDFLDIYYSACSVLKTKQDFYDLMYSYLKKASAQGCTYAEIFFDPQTHLKNNISFPIFFSGFKEAIIQGYKDFAIEGHLIMCFLRDLPEKEAIDILESSSEYKNDILAIGLDSAEIGNPPELFANLFKIAKNKGYRLCCHAGEEGPADNIRKCIDMGIERIDHGIKVINDEELLKFCAEIKIPFTLCPLSNLRLKIFNDLKSYPLKKLLEFNLLVTVNSDDPAYFRGYIGDNYLNLAKELGLELKEIVLLAKNSFLATFLKEDKKKNYIESIDNYLSKL